MKKREETRTRHPDAMYAKITLPGELKGEHYFKIPSPLVGAAWHHEKWDLEAVDKGDLLAYGDEVFEELHDAGYRFEWMLLLSSIVITEIANLAVISEEVRNRLGFSKPKKAKRASTNSRSRKPTSAAPSPTTA